MSNQQSQNNNQNQQNNNRSFGSRFGSRPGTANQNQQAPTATPPNPFNRPRPALNNPNQRSWHIQPLMKTIVHFELKGLGDPFYRLLNHNLNPDFGDSRAVAAALEKSGEAANEMRELLDDVWASYNLDGAFLIYNWNPDLWRTLITPPPPPPQQQQEDEESNDQPVQQNQPPLFHCLRAIDLELVLNVLARSRTQLLIAHAPLVFSQQYLTRSIMTDDPRLIALTKATGYMEES